MKRRLWILLPAFMLALILCAGSALADEIFCSGCGAFVLDVTVKKSYSNADGHAIVQTCASCGTELRSGYAPHSGGTANCKTKKTCDGCGAEYGEYGDHKYDDRWSRNAERHWQECMLCGARKNEGAHTNEDGDHLCDVCDWKLSGHDFSAANTDAQYLKSDATCTAPALYYKSCVVCGEKGTDTFESGDPDPDNHALLRHAAKAPGCTQSGWEAYVTCERCDYTNYMAIPATGHDYAIKTVKPTCEKDGYSSYVCDVCGDHFIGDKTARLLHWYAEWMPNGDGTHSAPCKREGCNHIATTECAQLEYKKDANVWMVCPVCGGVSDGTRLAWVEGAVAAGVRLPLGELTVRIGDIACGDTIMTVAFEYEGKITTPDHEITITLPDASSTVRLTPDVAALRTVSASSSYRAVDCGR